MDSTSGTIDQITFSFSSSDSFAVERVGSLVGDATTLSTEPDLAVRFHPGDAPNQKGARTLGSGISCDSDVAYHRTPLGLVRVELLDSGRVEVDCFFRDRVDRRVRALVPNQQHVRDQFIQVVARAAIYLPAQLLLRERHNKHTAHASAVADIDGSGVAVFALNGVGKSTLALASVGTGSRLISDNYVLHDRCKMYRFPEALRFAGDLPKDVAMELEGYEMNKKRVFSPAPGVICNQAKISKALVLSRGPEASMTRIDATTAALMIERQSAALGELLETSWLAIAAPEIGFEPTTFGTRTADLRAALADSDCFSLQIADRRPGLSVEVLDLYSLGDDT